MSWLANVLYLQGQNIAVGVSGGVNTLGLWTLATRVMQVPNLIYVPLNQVAFPAFSQLVAAGEDPKPLIERVASVSSAASAIVLPSFLVAMPGLIPAVFGEQWTDAWLVLPGITLAIFIAAPTVAPCSQFLFAANKPSIVLNATVVANVVGLCAITALTWAIGFAGAGLGTVATAVIESYLLARAVRSLTGAAVWTTMPSLLATSVVAAAAGFGVATIVGYGVLGALVASLTAMGTATLGCAITQPTVFRDLLHIVRKSLRVVFRERGESAGSYA
jgi:O-antigen/teichoic acid export membrane protein